MIRSLVTVAVLIIQAIVLVPDSNACPPSSGYRCSVPSRRVLPTRSAPAPAVPSAASMELVGHAVCVKDRSGTIWLAELLGDRRTAEELVAALRGRGLTAWSAPFLAPKSTSYAKINGRNAVGIAIQRGEGGARAFAVRPDRRVEAIASIP